MVRVALSLDPDTARVHAVSDPIPDVFGGVKLDLRSIAVHVSRSQFTLNPTNCDPKTVDGTLFGGGANPADPAAFFSDPVSTPFQATGCEGLPFGPKLYLRLFGHKKDFRRNGHPRLRAVLVARGGDANIGRAVTVLPQGILLDQSHIRTVCTRDQFATHACPSGSVYGYATACSPLLDRPSAGRSTCGRGPTRCRTWSRPCTARSTSTWSATPTRRGAAGCGASSTRFPTCPSPSSSSGSRAGARASWSPPPISALALARLARASRRKTARGRVGSRFCVSVAPVRTDVPNANIAGTTTGTTDAGGALCPFPSPGRAVRVVPFGGGSGLASRRMSPTVSVVIVAWNSREELRRTLPALGAELGEGDELVVVDNASEDGTAEAVAELAPAARIVRLERNVGFAAGCNAGADAAAGELLVILNPDAAPLPGFGEAIRRPWVQERGWAAWQALVAEGGATRINSAGNPVHFTGIAWAGGHGRPIEEAPSAGEVPTLSGACLAIPRATWSELGGLAERFFLYHEDVDLSLRLRLRGGVLGIEPSAIVDHDYEFGSNDGKWRWLERNRWACVIRTYPASLLVLVAPALLATELALIPVAFAGGWGRQKLAAMFDVLRWLPRLLRERRRIQAARTVSAARFAVSLTADLDSPFIGGFARSAPVRLALRGYWRVVRLLLGAA